MIVTLGPPTYLGALLLVPEVCGELCEVLTGSVDVPVGKESAEVVAWMFGSAEALVSMRDVLSAALLLVFLSPKQ